jgi:hypothetical protein
MLNASSKVTAGNKRGVRFGTDVGEDFDLEEALEAFLPLFFERDRDLVFFERFVFDAL